MNQLKHESVFEIIAGGGSSQLPPNLSPAKKWTRAPKGLMIEINIALYHVKGKSATQQRYMVVKKSRSMLKGIKHSMRVEGLLFSQL